MSLKAVAAFLGFLCLTGIHSAQAAFGGGALVNTAQTTSTVGLNFTAAGTHQQIALILINSNDETGFNVTFTFENKGYFKSGAHQIPMSNIVLNKLSGTLGAGLTEPVDMPIVLDGAGSWTWHPSPPLPTTETDGYLLEIAVDWAKPASGIAGFYLERITCVIASGI